MKISDVIQRAGRNLRQAKMRTLLTSLAIAVGAFTVSLALAAGAGGRAYVDQIVSTSGDKKSLAVYKPSPSEEEVDVSLPEFGVPPAEEAPASDALTEKDIRMIDDVDGVAAVQPSIYFETQYVVAPNGKKLVAPVQVKADRTELVYAAGSLDNSTMRAGQLVMPETFLEQFGIKDATSALGKSVTVRVVRDAQAGEQQALEKTLTITAVDRESDTTLYYSPTILVSTADGEELYDFANAFSPNKNSYFSATVQVASGYDVPDVKAALEAKGLIAYSLSDSREDLLQAVNIVQWGMAGFGALAILASIFGIINTQYISVLERTQQIGLMKALGARRKDIGRLFRYEAAWVGALGGAIGVVLALGVSLANPLIASFLDLEDGTRMLIVEPLTSLVLILALMLVAVASGYFPARKAAKLDPIEALRSE